MTSLKDRLLAVLAFSRARYIAYYSNSAVSDDELDGAEFEHARTRALVEALVSAIGALKCNETFHRLGGIDDCEPCKARAHITEALAKVEDMRK